MKISTAKCRLLLDAEYYSLLMNVIPAAKSSIYASVFSFNLHPAEDGGLHSRTIFKALMAASKRGVDVRVLVGGSAANLLDMPPGNSLAATLLPMAGVKCRTFVGKGSRASHSKFLIVDGELVICGSHHWSPRAFAHGRDTSIAIASKAAAKAAMATFKSAWASAKGERAREEIVPGVPLSAVLCGEYGDFMPKPVTVASRDEDAEVRLLVDDEYLPALKEAVASAKRTLSVSMFYFSRPTSKKHPNFALIGDLLKAQRRGVAIRILLDADRPTDKYHSTRINQWVADYLNGRGVPVQFDSPEEVNHTKCVVVDGERVLLGSHNWTRSSYQFLHDMSVDIRSSKIAAQCEARVLRWPRGPGRVRGAAEPVREVVLGRLTPHRAEVAAV